MNKIRAKKKTPSYVKPRIFISIFTASKKDVI